MIDDGKVILEGNVENIKQDFKENIFEVSFEGELDIEALNGNITLLEKKGNTMQFKLKEGMDSNRFLSSLMEKGISILSFNEILPSLNEIFIRKVEEND